MGRREFLVMFAVGGFAVAGTVGWAALGDWGAAWTTPVARALLLGSIWLLAAASLVLVRWRPASRLWVLMAALSVVWSWFVVTIATAAGDSGLFDSRWLVRSILYFVLLAWPSGYLRSGDRIWLTGYTIVQGVLLWVVPQLLGDSDRRLFVVADVPALVEIARSFSFGVVLPVGGVVLYMSIRRHAEALPPAGRRLHQPIVLAAGVAMVAHLVVAVAVASESGFDGAGRPGLLGGVFLAANFLPCATTPILATVAVRRARESTMTTTSVDVGSAETVLRNSLLALDDDGVDVRFAGPAGSWLDREGRLAPGPEEGSTVVEIRRCDEVLATVATGHEVSPDDVERIVAAAGASVDFARLAAIANANRRDAANARRATVDARDAALARLERDLHDGAQQRLVGLALQTSMAKRLGRGDDDSVVHDLRMGVHAARREIAETASGLLPAVVGAHGLEASLANLGACAAMQVEIDVDLPGDIPAEIATAAWFVAAESVANTAKHADATRLRIVGSVSVGDDGGRCLELVVDDDGRGGADLQGSGFGGLRTRVDRLGGALDVKSPAGGGTVVRTSLPLPCTNGTKP